MRPHDQPAASEIEFEPAGHQDVGRHDLGAVCIIAEGFMQPAQIIVAALGQCARQLGMADEIGMIVAERGGPENMIGMDVGHDHIADRQPGSRTDRRAQLGSLAIAAAGIDHRDGIVSDDKSDIGDLVVVFRRRIFLNPLMDKDAGRNFCDGQRR